MNLNEPDDGERPGENMDERISEEPQSDCDHAPDSTKKQYYKVDLSGDNEALVDKIIADLFPDSVDRPD